MNLIEYIIQLLLSPSSPSFLLPIPEGFQVTSCKQGQVQIQVLFMILQLSSGIQVDGHKYATMAPPFHFMQRPPKLFLYKSPKLHQMPRHRQPNHILNNL